MTMFNDWQERNCKHVVPMSDECGQCRDEFESFMMHCKNIGSGSVPTQEIAESFTQKIELNDIDSLAEECWQIADSKGWHEVPREFGELIALIHSEASEALECFRDVGYQKFFEDGGTQKPCGVPSELIDILIRVFDTYITLHKKGLIDNSIVVELRQKMAYNRTRSHRHGGKRL